MTKGLTIFGPPRWGALLQRLGLRRPGRRTKSARPSSAIRPVVPQKKGRAESPASFQGVSGRARNPVTSTMTGQHHRPPSKFSDVDSSGNGHQPERLCAEDTGLQFQRHTCSADHDPILKGNGTPSEPDHSFIVSNTPEPGQPGADDPLRRPRPAPLHLVERRHRRDSRVFWLFLGNPFANRGLGTVGTTRKARAASEAWSKRPAKGGMRSGQSATLRQTSPTVHAGALRPNPGRPGASSGRRAAILYYQEEGRHLLPHSPSRAGWSRMTKAWPSRNPAPGPTRGVAKV